jgi:hypothetical protein
MADDDGRASAGPRSSEANSNSLQDAPTSSRFPSEVLTTGASASDNTYKWSSSVKSVLFADKESPSTTRSPSRSEPSLRINPVLAKKMKLTREAAATGVIDFSSERKMKAVSAPTDDDSTSYESKLKIRKSTNDSDNRQYGIFGAPQAWSYRGATAFVPAGNMLAADASLSNKSDLTNPSIKDVHVKKREKHKMPPKRTTWWQVTLYIINDTVGAWLILYSAIILGLYGWIVGLLLLVLFWPLNLYAAHVLWRCRNVFPGAISLGDLVFYLTRSTFAMYLTFFLVNATILLTLASQIETASANIYWFFSDNLKFGDQQCYVIFLAGITAGILPLTQLRYLHSLTFMNAVNILCMLLFVCISIAKLAETGVVDPNDINDIGDMNMSSTNATHTSMTRIGLNREALDNSLDLGEEVSTPILGIDILLMAYYYQLIILEVIAEMKEPAEFPKANYWATPVVLFATIASAVTQYYFLGETAALTDQSAVGVLDSIYDKASKGRDVLGYVAIICFSIHMIGCCVIRSVVLTRSIHLLINPSVANQTSWRFRAEWMAISLLVLALAWILTLFIRKLGIMSFINGLLALVVSIILPIVLYILCSRKRKLLHTIPKAEWVLIAVILIFSTACFIVYFIKLGERFADEDFQPSSTLEDIRNIMNCSNFNY